MTVAFLADAMLGKLTRWLRILGFDSDLASSSESDSELIERAESSGRVLVTRDEELHKRADRSVLLKSDHVEGQVLELVNVLQLELPEELHPEICAECNGSLLLLHKDSSKGLVPRESFEAFDEFWKCSECDKVYWKGSHWQDIKEFLERVKTRV